jgi:DnaJ-class molecular chaperone
MPSPPFPSHLLQHIQVLFPAQLPFTLGLQEVKDAYKVQVLKWHPDRCPRDANDAVRREFAAHIQRVNEAKDVLNVAIADPCWRHGPASQGHKAPSGGGQRGSKRGPPDKEYVIRVARFAGTISGIAKGELTPRSVETQLDNRVVQMKREIVQLVVGLELHDEPADPLHDHHIHFVLEVDARLCHKSSE